MSRSYHFQQTSRGWKKAIRPYWNRYHAGKAKGLACPMHDVCLAFAGGSKRSLYPICTQCLNVEGYPRANYMTETYYRSQGSGLSTKSGSSHLRRKHGSFEGQIAYSKKEFQADGYGTTFQDRVVEEDVEFQAKKRELVKETT